MKISASEFKAKCLSLLDRVHDTGQPITITKRGRVMAVLQPVDDRDEKPWLRLRGSVKWLGDPFAPVVKDPRIKSLE